MYTMYLGGVKFPILPASLDVTRSGKSKTITLINDGEISIVKPEGLQEISFDVILPALSSDGNGADYYLKAFEAMMGKPVRFILVRRLASNGALHSTNVAVSIESLKEKDDTTYGCDMLVSFKLKQWKPYGIKVL